MLNVKNKGGDTPLMLALLRGRTEVVKAILERISKEKPELVFEELKKMIVTIELNFHLPELGSKQDFAIVEKSLLLLKKNCTEEEFAAYIGKINQSINSAINETLRFKKGKDFDITNKYPKILQTKTPQLEEEHSLATRIAP